MTTAKPTSTDTKLWRMVAAMPEPRATRAAKAIAGVAGYDTYTHPRTGAAGTLAALLSCANPITASEAASMYLERHGQA